MRKLALKEYTFLLEGTQGFLSGPNFIFTSGCFHTKPVALAQDNRLAVRHTSQYQIENCLSFNTLVEAVVRTGDELSNSTG
jgi:hypothetical protein